MRFLLCAMIPVLWACRSETKGYVEPSSEGQVTSDADGDGFLIDEDCDDDESSINPNAVEVCDGVDNNCDGIIDEGVSTVFYADADGDGFGDDTATVSACESPEGYVPNANDCDDGSDAVHPGVPEVCDGIDNNCDGQIDEDIGDVYYRDGDGDGYGTEEGATLLCTLEEGYSTEIGDCDDDNNTVFPGVEEMCDGLDNDCDGETDEDVGNAFYVDSDGDGFGDSTQEIFSCSRPEGYIENDWDCNDADDSIFPGAAELCDGIDNNCDEIIDGSDVTDGSLWYADSDGDGFGSLSDVVQSCEQPTGYVDNYNDCNDTDASVSGSATWYFDYDQDGYGDAAYSVSICQQPSGFVSNDDDCNDSDALQNPTSDWYLDLDGDGYGANISMTQCEQPTGFVMNDSDCDDTEELAYTGATEVCDYVDNDCNGSIDENVLDDWYLDYDQDGYGDDDTFQEACEAPTLYHVNVGGDCDDEDPAYSPGVAEGCNGLDLNCDGLIDNDVDVDGYSDATCGGSDCDDSDATIFPASNGICALGETCLEILNNGKSSGSGQYGIDPDGYGTGLDPFSVYCDMDTDGGGWTEIAYSDDLAFQQHFSSGDFFRFVSPEFSLALSDAQIEAIQDLSTEGWQEYVGLCDGVIHHYYSQGNDYSASFGFRYFDGTETDRGVSFPSSNNPEISVTQDGCAGNGGEGGDLNQATVFLFESPLVPILSLQCSDCGDGGEEFGSPLTSNPAWLR